MELYREKVKIKKFIPGEKDGHLHSFLAPTMQKWTLKRLGRLVADFNASQQL